MDMIAYVNFPPDGIDLIGDYDSEWLVDFTIECPDAYIPSLAKLKVINANGTYSAMRHFGKLATQRFVGLRTTMFPTHIITRWEIQ